MVIGYRPTATASDSRSRICLNRTPWGEPNLLGRLCLCFVPEGLLIGLDTLSSLLGTSILKEEPAKSSFCIHVCISFFSHPPLLPSHPGFCSSGPCPPCLPFPCSSACPPCSPVFLPPLPLLPWHFSSPLLPAFPFFSSTHSLFYRALAILHPTLFPSLSFPSFPSPLPPPHFDQKGERLVVQPSI